MADLPEIVRQRLERMSRVDDPGRPDAASAHPDLNMLAAFAEQGAPPELRHLVLGHLTGCATCRDLVRTVYGLEPQRATAGTIPITAAREIDRQGSDVAPEVETSTFMPAEELARKLVPAVPVRRDNRESVWWTTPRIAAVAAAMILVAGALWWRHPLHRQRFAAPAVAMTPSLAPALAPVSEAPPENAARSDDLSAGVESASKGPLRAVVSGRGSKNVTAKSAVEPKPESSGDLARNDAANAESLARQESDSRGSKGLLRSLPAPPTGEASRAHSAVLLRSNPEPNPGEAPSESAQVPMIQAGPGAQAVAPAARTGNSFAASASFQRAALVPPGSKNEWRIAVQAQDGKFTGRLERSMDGGRSWQMISVNDSVSLNVVAGNENDLWVGGAARTLYHSADAGFGWQRVSVAAAPGGRPLRGSIVGITVTNPLRILVTTDSHEVWSTGDGGITWKLTSN